MLRQVRHVVERSARDSRLAQALKQRVTVVGPESGTDDLVEILTILEAVTDCHEARVVRDRLVPQDVAAQDSPLALILDGDQHEASASRGKGTIGRD